jgi:hypothetical protein
MVYTCAFIEGGDRANPLPLTVAFHLVELTGVALEFMPVTLDLGLMPGHPSTQAREAGDQRVLHSTSPYEASASWTSSTPKRSNSDCVVSTSAIHSSASRNGVSFL